MLAFERRWRRQLLRDPSVVLYLPLYELDGSSFMDKSPYGHLCTVTGAVYRNTGWTFDGTDDAIDCGKDASMQDMANMTMIAWFYQVDGAVAQPRIIGKQTATAANYGPALSVDASMRLEVYGDFATTPMRHRTNAYTSFLTWHHAAFTWDGSSTAAKCLIYFNGAECAYGYAANGVGARVSDAAYSLIIGNASDNSRQFQGTIGDCWVYNRILTASEIQHNYQETRWRYK